jgi:LPXTG-motif cell wall-anchored protein
LVYKLCSVDDGNSETPIPCDTATVTITIAAPQAAATTPTTVAAAAALPRTGSSSSGPLTGAALALLVLGVAALLAGQSKTAVRRP